MTKAEIKIETTEAMEKISKLGQKVEKVSMAIKYLEKAAKDVKVAIQDLNKETAILEPLDVIVDAG